MKRRDDASREPELNSSSSKSSSPRRPSWFVTNSKASATALVSTLPVVSHFSPNPHVFSNLFSSAFSSKSSSQGLSSSLSHHQLISYTMADRTPTAQQLTNYGKNSVSLISKT